MAALGDPAEGQAAETRNQPSVWLVLGDKKGDNGQVETLAGALGWDCERKHLRMREPYVLGKPRVVPSLHHIDPSRSDPLEPPWPDLVITIGRRPSMAALWIREQSGGHTKIVLVGKPSCAIERLDLIIASSEAHLPPLPNVMSVGLPLMQVDEDAVAAAGTAWRPRFAELPRPLIGIMVGGPTSPFAFDASVVNGLVKVAEEIVRDRGGTPYITTSRRTTPSLVAELKAKLPPEARLFEWSPEAVENPYLGLLDLADGFVVTGDSVSMMVEIVRLRKPLAIFPLPTGRLGALDQARRSFARWIFSPSRDSAGSGLRIALARVLYRLGLLTQTRDFRAFHRMLIDRGLAVRLGEGLRPPQGDLADNLATAVARIKALMGCR
ncbi:MAG: ELM1/GtrOC1 family putative glycosyltransferase [Kiloniellales bacterium]|nr:ELM1/GtrOC1 family putative glycosyltransferase [Kiloniellales bacterium]